METIHLKSVDPLSQELLRRASRGDIPLSWERYERQQPQDGFVRLGLTCPFGCMQGPCRIDPFRRGAEKGICGLDGDGMVAALLLRLVQQGLLETLAGKSGPLAGEVRWPAALEALASSAVKTLGDGSPLSLSEIAATAALLQRPSASPEQLLKKALRLGLMAVALRGETLLSPLPGKGRSLQIGYGLLADDKITIGVAGNPPSGLIAALMSKVAATPSAVQVVSLGDWIPVSDAYLPFVCTSGEAELAVSSGNISCVVAGPDADPSLSELCRMLDLPFLLAGDAVAGVDKIMSLVHARSHGGSAVVVDPCLVAEALILSPGKPMNGMAATKKMALVGGCDDLRQSLGYLPVDLAFALRGQEFAVGTWGDAALWMIKNGFAAADQGNPAIILDYEAGPLTVIAALAAAGRLGELAGVCITGLKNCADLAFALGLSALGAKVCLATPLPIWGSEQVRRLVAEILAEQGGLLTHFDHPAGLPELVSWFTEK